MITSIIFYASTVWLACLLGFVVVRLGAARTVAERILAIDLLTLILVGLLALTARREGRPYVLDTALALALLSFIATLAACRYYEDRRPFS
ncbi:MAG: monovalent cation/H+ antiporter complex subunit F [Thermoleophilia bacterium]